MLRLNHFFKGKLKREEPASAFLAMALEGVPSFRRHFFSVLSIPPELQEHLSTQQWSAVAVEEDAIDVYLATSGHVVLIENKIRYGAKQDGQLLRYYRRERKKPHHLPIVAVYVAPGEMGGDEVEDVTENGEFQKHQPNDHAVHLSWVDLVSYQPPHPDHDEELLMNGLAAIAQAIEEGMLGVYPPVPERIEIRSLVDQAFGRLTVDCPSIGFHRWSAKREELIRTNRTIVTIYAGVHFECGPKPDFRPEGTRGPAGEFKLGVYSEFRLAGGIARRSGPHEWWSAHVAQQVLDVPAVGRFTFDSVKGRFHWEEQRLLTGDAMAAELVRIATAVVGTVTADLKTRGLPLGKDDLTGGDNPA